MSTTRISVAALAAALVLFLAACAGGPTAPVGEAPGQNAEGRTAATGATGAGGTATGAFPAPDEVRTGVSQDAGASPATDAEALLPIDPAVVVGRLDNGLTYLIRRNGEPQNRLELRLAVNAGSVLESERQRGLAHFLEHMAFNGTESFARQEIVDYLESIGMRFGPEVNAYTSFDETVYRLTVPTEDSGIVETAVRILEEWAHDITLDPQEVERERGVIVEEWRLGRGADARMADEQYPVLFHGSRYAERLPIGELSVIQSADREELVRFYRDWYRPELMSVVAVGDVDPAWMESLVRERFGRLPAGRAEPERPVFDLPPHEQTLYAPATDPEATSSRVAVYMKHAAREVRSFADYRRELVEALYTGMINERFREIARQAEAPFVGGYAFSRRLVRSADGYILAAQVRDGRILPSLESLLVETERVRRYGFTASELQRRKEELMTWIEQAYRERDNQESDELARSYVDHFLDGEPIPSLELEYELFQRYLPEISLEEVNDQVRLWLQEQNRVVLVNAPESEAASVPSRQEVLALFADVAKRELDAYEDRVVTEPLLAAELSDKAIVERREIPELGVTQWRLANGVQVVLKPTTFKRDEILFGAFSPGGTSLVPDRDYVAAATAAAIVARSGVGPFDDTELRRILAGKAVEVTPWIGELQEGLQGSARPEDLETLFQLIYLYFTEPRKDPEAYAAYKNRLDTQVRNRRDSPGGVFWDTVREVLTQGHVRGRPWSTELLEEMDLDTSLAVYRERFRDAGDFTFVFAGSLDVARVEPLVRKYLGSLPSTGREETWRDVGVNPPNGVVQREVRKGLEPQSRVLIAFSGTTPWSLETRLQMEGLKEALDIRLREVVREEAGGSYDVGVDLEFSRDPDQQYILYVSFGCAPEQVQRLTGLVFEEAERMRASGPPEQVAAKAREILRREHEQNVRENSYWVSSLELVYSHGLDPLALQEFDRRVSSITATNLRELSRRVLDPGRYVRVVLMPEQPK